MTATKKTYIIVGGGLGGALLAVYLGKAGYNVEVYEKRPDLRAADISAGRSINLALSTRGIHALERVGLVEKVMGEAVAMPGRMIHSQTGALSFQPYGKAGEAIHSVSRGGLNHILLDAAETFPNVKLAFEHKCVDVDLDGAIATFETGRSGEKITAAGDLIIGADGAFSAVRRRMQRQDRFSFSIDYLDHGYKELTIPPAADGGYRMEKHALHIWPRRSFMTIALPNGDGSYTVTCFWPMEGPNSFANLQTPEQVTQYFKEVFPDAVPHMPTLEQDFFDHPTSSLGTIRCRPWYHSDKVVLLGDAAHAVVPFYGQGMNASFEDCEALFDGIVEHADQGEAIRAYFENRKEDADAIADLALANFIEMRDHTGSPAFRRKKKREKWLSEMFPTRYIPLYSMVSFTTIPYAETIRRAARQDRLIGRMKHALLALAALVVLIILWLVLR